jgi:hypothetical protein
MFKATDFLQVGAGNGTGSVTLREAIACPFQKIEIFTPRWCRNLKE